VHKTRGAVSARAKSRCGNGRFAQAGGRHANPLARAGRAERQEAGVEAKATEADGRRGRRANAKSTQRKRHKMFKPERQATAVQRKRQAQARLHPGAPAAGGRQEVQVCAVRCVEVLHVQTRQVPTRQ